VLTMIGDLSIAGICLLAWAQFRRAVPAPLFAAAGFLLLQLSYFQAALMASAALPNIGVVCFSLACLHFATRESAAQGAAGAAFGVAAAGSQANGLFALPMAAAACLASGRRTRGAMLALLAALLWGAYFLGYAHPPGHPSVTAGLRDPLAALELFLVVLGGVVPGLYLPMAAGGAILAGLGWLTVRGAWRAFPAAGLWVAFLLLSAAAAAAGRVGFGVFWASRYAVYSSTLLVVAFLAACALRPRWSAGAQALAIVGCMAIALGVSWRSWEGASEFSRAGRLLARAVPAEAGITAERYFGIQYPNAEFATRVLDEAARRGLYAPPVQRLYATATDTLERVPTGHRIGGFIDHVTVAGNRVAVDGWTDVTPLAPGRRIAIYPATGTPRPITVAATPRLDVALLTHDPANLFSGFRVEVDYPTATEAAAAAERLCVVVGMPGGTGAVPARANGNCPPREPR